MVKKTDLTQIFIRLQELNEKIDNNNKLLNDILKLFHKNFKKN